MYIFLLLYFYWIRETETITITSDVIESDMGALRDYFHGKQRHEIEVSRKASRRISAFSSSLRI